MCLFKAYFVIHLNSFTKSFHKAPFNPIHSLTIFDKIRSRQSQKQFRITHKNKNCTQKRASRQEEIE